MVRIKDDPQRPYKAYAGVIAAVATYLLTQQVLELPPVAVVVLNIFIVGLSVYTVPNPKTRE